MPLLAAIVLILSASASDAGTIDSYADARRALVAAFQAENFESALVNVEAALRFRPGYPPLLSARARVQARLGQAERALESLSELAGMGIVMDVSEDDAFRAVRELKGYSELRDRQAALSKPIGAYRVAARLNEPTFIPEGIAVDAKGRIYLGSIRHARIARVAGDQAETLVADRAQGLASVFGMRIDEPAGLLWVATAMVEQGDSPDPDRLGRSGIFRFRLDSGKFVDAYWLPDDGADHVLGDLILTGAHKAVTTDSLTGAVLELDTRDGDFNTLIGPGRLASPQGVVHDGRRGCYFIADWSGGLYRFHRASGELVRLEAPPGSMLYGIDGLYRHGSNLIAVQNLARPHRVTRIRLDAEGRRVIGQETIARSLPEFDEPTLGVIRKDTLYLNANSHWNRFDADNQLPEADSLSGPVVLAIPLGD